VTGTPTAGIDPQELIDTRPYAREWHFHILNDRALYGLPRKFNVGFDGGGIIPVLEDTNDIGFQAVEVDGHGIEPGIWFRLALGGITGHRDFARDTGAIVKPKDATKVADAVVRVFIEHGDRTNRNKARLKYVLDAWGLEKFLAAVEKKLGSPLTRAPAEAVKPRPPFDRAAHIGVQAQKQQGLNWIGVAFPVGKITVMQIRGLAKIAQDLGDGDIRLTVWQNLLISGVADDKVALAEAAIVALGLTTKASAIRAGLVSCTGATGCRFAAAHTKEQAEEIAAWCEPRVSLDTPVNIHLTGCHHSCAQHYIGDIGLIAARVAVNEEGDTVDGYHVLVGGGFGPDAAFARDIYKDVKGADAPRTVERILKGYLANRTGNETFLAFSKRHGTEALKAMFDAEAAE
jgi:ferredoxin-nitrite reductase